MDGFDRFLLTVVYDIPSLIFVVDPETKTLVYANQRMLDTLGADCVGKRFVDCFAGAGGDHFFVSFSRKPADMESPHLEVPLQSEYYDDDSENWYHIMQRPVTWYDRSRKLVIVLNEINGLKRLQNELSEAHASLAFKNRELEIAARTDRLTQLNNRHQLDDVMERELLRFQRSRKPFSVLLIDCDYFKSVNDDHGHQVGDLVLIEMARVLRQTVRVTDTVGRWGGEEFLVIMPETELYGALQVGEKIRQAIDAHVFPTVGHRTASFGAAELRSADDIKGIIARADEALYLAKANGRNRVEAIG